jgi:cytoskeletal protein CcmA (bactofilin family)
LFFRTLSAALALLGSVLLSLQNPAEAAEFRSGVEVVIGPDEVLKEDLYAVARRIIVDGTIDGDLLAAGESIAVNGAVNGDLIIAGRSIAVSGAVEDDVCAAGAELRFHSSVGEDLIVAGDQIELASGAVIGQDLVAGGNRLNISGDVEGNLDLDVTEAAIAGTIGGNVQAIVQEQLTLGPDATIGGELYYTSTNEVSMRPGATVVAIPATVYVALLLLAKPIVAILIGDCFPRRFKQRENPSPVGALAFGAAMLAVIGLVPYADSIVGWLSLLLGFGMWLLYLSRRYRAGRAARVTQGT